MTLWPYRPLVGLRETLEFRTDPLISRTGEQRLALRSAPRQVFDMKHILRTAQFSRAKPIMRANAHLPLDIPIWAEQVQMHGYVDSTADVLELDTTAGDFRDRVLVWKDDQTYVVADIAAIDDTSITLTVPLGLTMRHPVVTPVREGINLEGFNIRRNTTIDEISTRFVIHDDTVDLAAEYVSDYPQYQSKDVMTERTLMVTDINEQIIRVSEYVDNGFGKVTVEPVSEFADFGQMIAFSDARPSALWRRRVWLHSLRGKQKTFWLPTFSDDLILMASFLAAATQISVKSIMSVNLYLNKHIMIQLNNGDRYFRQITTAVNDGDNDTLTLSSSLGVGVAPADIDLFCFISLVRLNSDSVSMDHNFALETITAVPVMEVPE